MSLRQRFLDSEFCRVFNFRDEIHKGRSLTTINMGFANVASAVISGALQTAFLAESGIDIVRVGIISLIPYFCWFLSIFSPMILAQFKKRQKLLLFNDFIYYGSLVFGTTIMPLFVTDYTERTIWFGVFMFIANASNALLGSGYTAWLIRFVPTGRDLNIYTAYTNLFNFLLSNGTGLIAGLAATFIAASGNQFWFLFWLRMAALVLFIGGSCMIYLVPKEEPVEKKAEKFSPLHVITEPLKHRAFRIITIMWMIWNVATGFNCNTYTYFLLETAEFPIVVTYISAFAIMLVSLFGSGLLRRLVDRISPLSMVALSIALFIGTEFASIFVGPGTLWLYVVIAALIGVFTVCFHMGFNSLFYLATPENSNKDLFATFWNLAPNVALFIGSVFGTWMLAIFEAHGTYEFLGMTFYGSQIICGMKVVVMVLTLLYTLRNIKYFREQTGM